MVSVGKALLCSIAKIPLFCCPLCVCRLLKKFTMWKKKGAEAEPEPQQHSLPALGVPAHLPCHRDYLGCSFRRDPIHASSL